MSETGVGNRPDGISRLTWVRHLGLGSVVVSLVAVGSALVGGRSVGLSTLLHALKGPPWPHGPIEILVLIRAPRVMTAFLVGWSLGTAGAVYQGLLQNPLAEPYLLGISGGAALGVTLMGLFTPLTIPLVHISGSAIGAFAGALLFTVVLIRLAMVRGRLTVLSMVLAGVVLNAIAAALVLYFTVTRDYFEVQRIALWLIGQIQPQGWRLLGWSSLWVLGWTFLVWRDAPYLNLMALDEDILTGWGLSVVRLRLRWLAYGAALAALSVALAGMVGFVGLVVPHAVRFFTGHDNRLLLPYSAFAGAVLMMLADTTARTLWSPVEMPVGVLTACLAGPYFLVLLRRSIRSGFTF